MVQVVEVEPPRARPPGARRPGARRRSWWQSMCLVVTSVFMACSMGLVATAPPAAALVPLAPLAASALRVAPSALKAFVKTPAGKQMVGGKWSKRLGLGVAITAGLAWLPQMGLPASDEMRSEAEVTEDQEPEDDGLVGGGSYRTWQIEDADWSVRLSYDNRPTVRFSVSCSGVSCDDGRATSAGSIPGVHTRFRCFNGSTGDFWEDRVTTWKNFPHVGSVSRKAPCYDEATRVYHSIHSAIVFNNGTGGTQVEGVATNQRWLNPNFDTSVLPSPGTGPADSITVQRQCEDSSGQIITVSNTLDGPDAIPQVACPEGTADRSVEWLGNRGSNQESLGGFDYDFTEFPECAGMECYLHVVVDGVPCRVGVETCYDWMRVEPKSRVVCEYGPYAVGLEQCRDLQYAFRTTQGVTWQEPNPNDPARKTGWVPANPDGTPNVGLLPEYWKPDPNPKPEYEVPPRWDDREQGDPGPQPTPTVQVPFPPRGANPDPNPHGDPPRDPENDNVNCISGMWSWNPVDWVFTPVKCALSWAFIPKPAAAGQLTATATATITDAGLGDWLGVPTAVASTIPEGGGCRGPALNMPEQLGGATYYPLDACDDPMSRYAALSRAVTSVVVVVLGGFVAVNGLSLSLTGYRLVERESKGTVST